jgi:hypothetical protein
MIKGDLREGQEKRKQPTSDEGDYFFMGEKNDKKFLGRKM